MTDIKQDSFDEKIHILVPGGFIHKSALERSVAKPLVSLTNVNITDSELVGSIYWVQKNTALVMTADAPLPDGTYMLMCERIIDATNVVDDARFKGVVSDGVMTINALFEQSGNYSFSAERMNRGLDRIGAPFHLAFTDIEFDVYV